jgi:hypothetical protein
MTPEEAMRRTFKLGNYYCGPVSALCERLAFIQEQLAVLEKLPGKMAAHRANEKRRMAQKFVKAIRSRLAWHKAELQRALDAGFEPSEHFEPQQRSIAYPKARRASANV